VRLDPVEAGLDFRVDGMIDRERRGFPAVVIRKASRQLYGDAVKKIYFGAENSVPVVSGERPQRRHGTVPRDDGIVNVGAKSHKGRIALCRVEDFLLRLVGDAEEHTFIALLFPDQMLKTVAQFEIVDPARDGHMRAQFALKTEPVHPLQKKQKGTDPVRAVIGVLD